MKFWIFTLLLLLTACGTQTPANNSPEDTPPAVQTVPTDSGTPSLAKDEEPTYVLCRIVDGAEDGSLLLAALDGDAGSVYRLPTEDLTVTLDGQPADASVLEDGMPVEVAYNGSLSETFPGSFGEVYSVAAWSQGQEKNPMGGTYDLCGLYLQVLDDLWKEDENVKQIAVNLSDAPGGLTESEKAALIWRFGEKHGVEAFAATYDKLQEIHLTTECLNASEDAAFSYYWEDGCFYSITANAPPGGIDSLPVLFFYAQRWRSSRTAYGFYGCSAIWGAGKNWTYQVGTELGRWALQLC